MGRLYVSGTHAGTLHLGNNFSRDADNPERLDPAAGANVTDLRSRFESSRYLSRHSDLVALLVLEHQMRMQILITRAQYDTRYALHDDASEKGESTHSDWAAQRIAHAGEALLAYMLFRDESPLPGKVKGTSAFAADFERQGPTDSKGRSLRQLDLNTRLFRYPCSFLVYSKAFDALPDEMKNYLWRRLEQVLTGADQQSPCATLSLADRQNVLEILRETKTEFRAWLLKAHTNQSTRLGRTAQ